MATRRKQLARPDAKRRAKSARVAPRSPSGRRARKPQRACILTAGGDAPGLNAVIRAFVKTCAGSGIEVFGSEDGFEGLIQPRRLTKLNRTSVRGILPRGGS